MKYLLLITERFPPDLGGVARSAGRIAEALCYLGYGVNVVTWSRYLQPGEVVMEPFDSLPLKIHRIGLYRHWDMSMPQTLNFLEWLDQTYRHHAVWGHYLFPAGFLATWFAQLQGLPSLVSARGNDLDRGIFPPGDFARLQWTLTQATLVSAVSQDLARKVNILSHRTAIAQPNRVDTDLFQPESDPASIGVLRQSLGIEPDEMVLGFSGELREKKGQQFLLQALTQVRSQRPACLLIIGEVRPDTQSLLQSYSLTHPEDAQRIIITGHLDQPQQVAQHLRLCDVYLQPSLWDGMPNALLEAMACGCGCIASDAGGIPEMIEHGRTGFLLPRTQLHHLGDAILEYWALPASMRQQIATAARDRIVTHYSLSQEAAQLQSLIVQLLGSE